MTTRRTIKIQLVECPNCHHLLPELPDVPVYECAGCGLLILAQHCRNYFGNKELGLPGTDVAGSSDREHESDDEEFSSANQCWNLVSEKKCRLDDDNRNTQNELGDCSRDQFEVDEAVSSSAEVVTCHENVVSPVVSQGDSEIVENVTFRASHGRPSTENLDSRKLVGDREISEGGKILVNGIMKRNIEMQNRVMGTFPTDKKHNTMKHRRRFDSDVPLRPTGHDHRTRLNNYYESARVPFYPRHSASVFEKGSPSHHWHDEFHRNSRYCTPDNPEHEKIKLSKMVYELRKQLEKTHIAKEQAEPRCIHIHCCDKVCSDQIQKMRCMDSQFSLPCYHATTRCNDQRYRYYVRNKFGMREKQKHHHVKRHFRSIAGGAPFVTCSHCLKPLQIPADLLTFKNRCHKLKCGACSSVFNFPL